VDLLAYSVKTGDTLSTIAKSLGTTTQKLTTLNGIKDPNAIKVGQTLKYAESPLVKATAVPVKPVTKAPNMDVNSRPTAFDPNWTRIPNQAEVKKYADQQAQSRYDTERIGYQNQIDLFNKQKGFLMTDDQIQKKVNERGILGYSDAFNQIANNRLSTQNTFNNSLTNLERITEDQQNQVRGEGFKQRAGAKEDLNRRGLYNSSILTDRIAGVDQAVVGQIANLGKELTAQVGELEANINTVMAQLDNDEYTLTTKKATELTALLSDLESQRDNKKAELDQNIHNQNNLINQAAKNKISWAAETYQTLYDKYSQTSRQDREYFENKRRWEMEYQLNKSKAAYSSGFTPYGGGGSSYTPWGKSGGSSSYSGPALPNSLTYAGGTEKAKTSVPSSQTKGYQSYAEAVARNTKPKVAPKPSVKPKAQPKSVSRYSKPASGLNSLFNKLFGR
jgi:LysM repeat protein